MFGFSNSRLHGPQMLSQQMQQTNQQLGSGAAPPASQAAFGAPPAGQVAVDPSKIWNGIKGFLPGQGQPAAAAQADYVPQIAALPSTYDPGALTLGNAAASAAPTLANAGGSILSTLASLFGV